MPRPLRHAPAGVCFHVLNRGNDRRWLFRKDADYQAFVVILTQALSKFEVDLLCWCLMPNHWHLVLRPRTDSALSRFMGWLSITHVRRHRGHYPSSTGHLYQGRYKSFPVQDDEHFLTLCRYVEANPLRAKLTARAEQWRWSSLAQRSHADSEPSLKEWPVHRPRNWPATVNETIPKEQETRIHLSIHRDRPLGSQRWAEQIAHRLGLMQTLAPRGRPRKPLIKLSPRQRRRRADEEGQKGR